MGLLILFLILAVVFGVLGFFVKWLFIIAAILLALGIISAVAGRE